MWKYESLSVSRAPVQTVRLHRKYLPHRFDYSVYSLNHVGHDCMRGNNPHPREKGMNEGPGKRSKAIMHQSIQNR